MVEKKINIALCSFGMSGWVFHAPFITIHPGLHLRGVLERTKNLAREKYPGTINYRTLEELLDDEEVELVVVNTPSITHYEFAKRCLEAGKHVIVEKPFTATSQEARELISIAANKNLKLSVYHNRRYDSDYRTVKKILDEGWIGDLVDVEIRYDRYVPGLSHKQHKETPTPAVGCLYDLGSHLIDQALQLFGIPGSVYADIRINREGSLVDDYFNLLLYYPSHPVTLRSSYFVREPFPGYALHGKLGSFIKTKTDVQELALIAGKIPGGDDWGIEPAENDGLLHTEKNGELIRKPLPSLKGNYGDYYDAIYRSIRNNAPLPVTGEEAMNVIRVIEAAFLSNKEKIRISL
ncbi:MAG: Gfo/Idh/MocA family oxidoreductase [Chitinophagaceae bacterium]|nr:Gfo/Idh/MocA family oxidoreductase [Chitinophagaceae bacterium]